MNVGAVRLKVADLDNMIAFYQGVIGLDIRNQSGPRAEMGTSRRTLVILESMTGGRFVRHQPGLFHMALRAPGRTDLGCWLRHYAELEAPFWQGASDHGVSEALYLSDPEGNGIEIYCDRPVEDWPRGEDGDLDMYTRRLDLDDLLEAGESVEWNRLPDVTDMGHVHLKISNTEDAKPFYNQGLGLELIAELPGSALFLAYNGYHHHIGLNTWESKGAPPSRADAYGLRSFALLFPDEGDVLIS